MNPHSHGGTIRPLVQRSRAALAAAALAATLTACSTGPVTDKGAATIVAALTDQGRPIQHSVTYDEKSDLNKLLGRPGSYTSKAAFVDQRAEYIKAIATSSPLFAEYTYAAGNVVVRVSKEITPTDAAAFETALGKIMG